MQSEEKKRPIPIVGAIIINNKDKILLSRGKKWSGKYAIPGGHVELNETLEDAIKREAKEETGLDIEIIARLGFGESVNSSEYHKKKHFIFVTYLCKLQDDGKKVEMNEEFEKEFVWLTLEKAKGLDLTHGVRSSLKDYEKYLDSRNCLDSWKRCQADFENYKKDQAKAREEFIRYSKMDIIEQILPVLDNFEASLAHVPEKNKENGWVEGIIYIKKQLEDVLRNNDILEIPVKIGDKFNPEIHEAVGGDGRKQKVAKIIQKGHRMNGRIIRAAKVEVG